MMLLWIYELNLNQVNSIKHSEKFAKSNLSLSNQISFKLRCFQSFQPLPLKYSSKNQQIAYLLSTQSHYQKSQSGKFHHLQKGSPTKKLYKSIASVILNLNHSTVIRFYLLMQIIILTMLYLPQLTILLILITLPYSAHSQSCVSTYTFDNSLSDCTFSYDYFDLACTQFNFLACTWDECEYYITVAGQDICVSSQTFTSTNWITCTNMCCDSGVQYPEIPDSITQCQDYLISYTNLTTIIGWSVFGGVLIIAGIITLIILIRKHGCRCRCRFDCCQCEFLNKCFGSFKEIFTKICCDCVLFRRREVPEHANEGDASKDIEMTINPQMNTPT